MTVRVQRDFLKYFYSDDLWVGTLKRNIVVRQY